MTVQAHSEAELAAIWRAELAAGGWHARPATAGEFVRVAFALQRTRDAGALLRDSAMALSNPHAPEYGAFASVAELAELLSEPAHAAHVRDWLHSLGVPVDDISTGVTGDWVFAYMNADLVARAFHAKLEAFSAHGVTVLRSRARIDVPAALAGSVRFVHGLSVLPVLRRATPVLVAPQSSAPHVTPQLLFALYNVTEPAESGTNVTQACAEFEHESWSPPDLDLFERHFRLPSASVTNVNRNSNFGHTEANLDVQYLTAMGQGLATEMWIEPGFGFDLVSWSQQVLARGAVPTVWSVSYGEASALVQASYAQALNEEFMKFASLGVSVIFASGDSGVWSRGEPTTGAFQPTFPASLPFVTAVGATMLNSAGQEYSSTPWSGGGFAPVGYFNRSLDSPWQNEAVAGYFASGVALPPPALYNSQGTAFPDVAALGVNFEVYMDLVPQPVSGTSCAAPTFAGIIAAVNSHRVAAGKKPLGFLNPWLYLSVPHCLTDIVHGDNANGKANGFAATVGYDPVTGLGSPRYQCLLDAALALP